MQNPSSFIQTEFVPAMNNHDLEKVVQCFDPKATITFQVAPPGFPSTLQGTEQIRGFFERMIDGFHAEPKDFQATGDQVHWTARITSNMLKQFAVDAAESEATATVKNGKIVSFIPTFPPDIVAKLQAASLSARQTTPQTGTTARPSSR